MRADILRISSEYDEPEFFQKYAEMPRSRLGLEAAGEWETLREMLPGFAGKRVLDLGCGYGWPSRSRPNGCSTCPECGTSFGSP